MANTRKGRSDNGHGSPRDRGKADAWYRRGCNPHYYEGASYSSERVEQAEMTTEEIHAYVEGYKEYMEAGLHKEWE